MLRDVFYYGSKPNAHPREKPAKNLEDARKQSTTEHFWVINEFCDYTYFDWDFDFEFLPDDEVWTSETNNVWPSQHQKDSGTWLCPKTDAWQIFYRTDVQPVLRKNIISENWKIYLEIDKSKFDFSWHPDPTSPPYIYSWGSRFNHPSIEPVVEYIVSGASEYKYMESFVELLPNFTNFKILHEIDNNSFDFSWRPNPTSPPYIYVWGNQHYMAESMPTIEYHTPGATERHFIDKNWHAKLKSKPELFEIYEDCTGMDYTWRPDPNAPPYIYAWGNQYNDPRVKASVVYRVKGAIQYKYMENKVVRKPCMDNWRELIPIDKSKFDYSWEPDANDPPFIYVFGNQWHNAEIESTIEYHVHGAIGKKYINDIKAIVLPDMSRWKLNYDIDKKSFDFSWRPDPGSPPYIYEFATVWNDRGGPLYIVPGATEKKYIEDIKAKLIPNKQNWKIIIPIEEDKFDFSWVPHPEAPPYIYVFGNQWNNCEKETTLEYIVPGATEKKYVHNLCAIVKQNKSKFKILYPIVESQFDFSWRPDPYDNPYIYVFGNNKYPAEIMPTIEYYVEGATEYKYVYDCIATLDNNMSNWIVPEDVDRKTFDFSWVPNPKDPPYIYEFATTWHDRGGPKYITKGATKYKYISDIRAKLKPSRENWHIPEGIDVSSFDFSWRPHPEDPPYIYQFGTQWQKTGGPKYIVKYATEVKYVSDLRAIKLPDKSKFKSRYNINELNFDYSWHPDETEEQFNYVFGNQHHPAEIDETIVYEMPKAKEKKFIHNVIAKFRPDESKFEVLIPIDKKTFDYTWRPDPTSPPYIYVWGNQWNSAEKEPTVIFKVDGATEYKYLKDSAPKVLPKLENFKILHPIVENSFDFSWRPDPNDPPYLYIFGNDKHLAELMPTIQYEVQNANQVKYINDFQAKLKIDMSKWTIPDNIDTASFDFSWIPDPASPPYIYEFATIWNDRGGPVYTVPGATDYKYILDICAKTKPDKTNFVELITIDDFDYSWVPHPNDPPYIYVFGNQWNPGIIESTVEYRVPNAIQKKYVNNITAKVSAQKDKFTQILSIETFDFSWRPDPNDPPYIYVFGNQYYSAEQMPTIEYKVDNAVDKKYINTIRAKLAPNLNNWHEILPVDKSKFDYSWVPNPHDPPYIYVFGNQWNAGEVEPTLQYVVPTATQYKYINNFIAPVLPDKSKFKILCPIEENKFDFSWRPNPKDPPYIYVFGNTTYDAMKMPTVIFETEGATEKKYIDNLKAVLAQNYNNFVEIIPVDKTSFDYSWVPDPYDPPYIYVFGNQYNSAEIEPTLEFRVENATERKYMHQVAKVLPNYNRWTTLIKVSDKFDFSWRPNPKEPPYIYVFGNQWNLAEIEPTLLYTVEGATQKKYVEEIIAEVTEDMTNWVIPEGTNIDQFDFSWRPNPGSPPYVYQFGTLENDNDGPRYVHPNNNGEIVRLTRTVKQKNTKTFIPKYYIETTLEDLVDKHGDELFWAIRKNINYSNFDFDWRPNIEQARYVQVFGSPDAIETQTYFVSGKMFKQGFTDFNFITANLKVESEYLAELFEQPDIFMIDRGNIESKERFEKLKERFPNIQKARYLNSYVDTIYRCLNKCKTQLAWILNSELDYSEFDFKYYPNPWQMKMVHVFGTQWSHWGTTYLLNKDTFIEDTKWVKIIEHLNNLNFVKNRRAKATNCLYDVYLIDYGNNETKQIKNQLQERIIGKNLHTINYRESYLETFKDILSTIKPSRDHYIWVCSSICDYSDFDFTYICDPFARDNLHVFSSDKQKFGDTFLIDVNKLKSLIEDMTLLEDYEKINYNLHLRTKRLPAPVVICDEDTHINMPKIDLDFPYAIFKTYDNKELEINYNEPLCLWDKHTKNIELLSTGGTVIIMPKEVKQHVINNQLYNYPFIAKSKKCEKSKPLDIVFLSNGEICAEENYKHLLKITKHLPNKIIRVDGVNGRVKGYHAAANVSATPWFFTVFAKLKVDESFDFNWQPDRLQQSKHYIFNALNPVNGLTYGHQAMIAYNKKLTLANEGRGLDFTLDDPHDVVDILSGIATFNTDPYSTWRTAFREAIKLKADYKDISVERLQIWLTKAQGEYAQYCLLGAKDGVEYYKDVNGDSDQLKFSYEWDWLQNYYNQKYR